MTVTISGYVEKIKKEVQFNRTHLVEFIVKQDQQREHYYILRALSIGDKDTFGIEKFVGVQIEAECYLNGRKSDSKKGTYYSNDLQVKTLRSTI